MKAPAVWDQRTRPSSHKTWSLLWRFCATCWPPSNHDWFHHTPEPTSTTVADDLNNISRFVFCEWTGINGEAFLSIAYPNVQWRSSCLPENESGDSVYQPLRTNHPPSTSGGAPDLRFARPPQMSHDASFGLYDSPWQVLSQFLPIPNMQQALSKRCPKPGFTCQVLPHSPDEHHEHTENEVTGFAEKRADDSGRTPFCNNALSTSSCLIQSKAPSTSAEATKTPTLHSAALLRTCLSVAITPAVVLPGSLPKMFVPCGFISRQTAVCKARMWNLLSLATD